VSAKVIYKLLSGINKMGIDNHINYIPQNICKVKGYCTLFLINNGQWSGGGLPIDRSPWSMDGGSLMG